MIEVFVAVFTSLIVGIPAYLVGRMVGEERGRVDAYRRIADLRRQGERR